MSFSDYILFIGLVLDRRKDNYLTLNAHHSGIPKLIDEEKMEERQRVCAIVREGEWEREREGCEIILIKSVENFPEFFPSIWLVG